MFTSALHFTSTQLVMESSSATETKAQLQESLIVEKHPKHQRHEITIKQCEEAGKQAQNVSTWCKRVRRDYELLVMQQNELVVHAEASGCIHVLLHTVQQTRPQSFNIPASDPSEKKGRK